ncbi:MAG: hypothetical protein US57_C0001G0061 [Candidatus Moranbacteria bacterium GW2011_GWC2_37_73]|nr:MAG: hypothetical protein UR95_C0001G0014 [Parcubacteria group bacterium GW2011_GWC1_36_108]KKQ00557.1 MAG: hypothetical protein US09_C0010G0006 [Candidatus Moranbacteria bacterium GW2011_GWD1_36_198]KKQ01843.1 MAG: hypothetical protein US10_C0008G0016 [Candidatus Moranbacteria bacterium GW2011_GWD2_36_198]KKQ40451.1 MAG: hypothetical protein US57_C0001G0061 [Candidatus Moranbacteria bacterium GW2011_GWC2_37_73]HAS00115.1 hypothetical protein [Candidatus Moranbacteria bacterium]
MFDEAKKSLEKNLGEKLVSPFWGAFIASWLVWNWRVWYVTFFVDSDLLMQSKSVLKIDYLLTFYPVSHLWSIAYSLFTPFLFSYLVVFWLPKITKKYYLKSLEYEYDIKTVKLKKEEDFLKLEGKKFQAEEIKLEAEEKVLKKETAVKKIKSEKSQEEAWDDEYEIFKGSNYFNSFDSIRQTYYEGNRWASDIPLGIKVYCDTHELIEIVPNSSGSEKFNLTEKGKYFMKKYSEKK